VQVFTDVVDSTWTNYLRFWSTGCLETPHIQRTSTYHPQTDNNHVTFSQKN